MSNEGSTETKAWDLNRRTRLWTAINAYTVACGGSPHAGVACGKRQLAVAEVERILEEQNPKDVEGGPVDCVLPKQETQWLVGWYATRLHAYEGTKPTNPRQRLDALCGAGVYPQPQTEWAQRRLAKEPAKCKVCERILAKRNQKLAEVKARGETGDFWKLSFAQQVLLERLAALPGWKLARKGNRSWCMSDGVHAPESREWGETIVENLRRKGWLEGPASGPLKLARENLFKAEDDQKTGPTSA